MTERLEDFIRIADDISALMRDNNHLESLLWELPRIRNNIIAALPIKIDVKNKHQAALKKAADDLSFIINRINP